MNAAPFYASSLSKTGSELMTFSHPFHLMSSLQAQRLARNLSELLGRHGGEEIPEREMVEELMGDTVKADKDKLPNTGCDSEWEFELSSIFVDFDTKLVRTETFSTFP